jgi:hypothetical protein
MWTPTAGPLAQRPAALAIGFLYSGLPGSLRPAVADFQGDLRETGYVQDQNVAIRLRWGDLAIRATPDASQRSHRPPGAVNYSAGGTAAVQPAKSSASTIPIVSAHGFEFVKYEAIVDPLRDSRTFRRLMRAEPLGRCRRGPRGIESLFGRGADGYIGAPGANCATNSRGRDTIQKEHNNKLLSSSPFS